MWCPPPAGFIGGFAPLSCAYNVKWCTWTCFTHRTAPTVPAYPSVVESLNKAKLVVVVNTAGSALPVTINIPEDSSKTRKREPAYGALFSETINQSRALKQGYVVHTVKVFVSSQKNSAVERLSPIRQVYKGILANKLVSARRGSVDRPPSACRLTWRLPPRCCRTPAASSPANETRREQRRPEDVLMPAR